MVERLREAGPMKPLSAVPYHALLSATPAFAGAGWYLMKVPMIPVPSDQFKYDYDAPISRWTQVGNSNRLRTAMTRRRAGTPIHVGS